MEKSSIAIKCTNLWFGWKSCTYAGCDVTLWSSTLLPRLHSEIGNGKEIWLQRCLHFSSTDSSCHWKQRWCFVLINEASFSYNPCKASRPAVGKLILYGSLVLAEGKLVLACPMAFSPCFSNKSLTKGTIVNITKGWFLSFKAVTKACECDELTWW